MKKKEKKALSVEGLTVSYDETPVLWDLNFEIPTGKLVGIVGQNGAGKSTLLKTLLNMTKPLSGKVCFWGEPFRKVRAKVAYVPQRSSVDWDFPITALDVVLMGRYGKLGYFKRVKAADRAAAFQMLERLGMGAFAERQISQLSGGQQQRLFIARALLQDADIYFMDEPFAGVDMATEKEIIALLDQLKMQGKTLLVVHHDLSTVDTYFDWVIMLNTCLVACGSVEEVFHTDTIMKTYGRNVHLLDTAIRMKRDQTAGIK